MSDTPLRSCQMCKENRPMVLIGWINLGKELAVYSCVKCDRAS